LRPTFSITPSFTAITGAPVLAKMSIERLLSSDSITLAAFWPRLTRVRNFRSARSSA
jgi:hypothetical protein